MQCQRLTRVSLLDGNRPLLCVHFRREYSFWGDQSICALCVRFFLIYFMHVMQVHFTQKTQTHTRLVLLQRARVFSLAESVRCALICTRRWKGLWLWLSTTASSDPTPDYIRKFEAIVLTQLYPDSPGIVLEMAGACCWDGCSIDSSRPVFKGSERMAETAGWASVCLDWNAWRKRTSSLWWLLVVENDSGLIAY